VFGIDLSGGMLRHSRQRLGPTVAQADALAQSAGDPQQRAHQLALLALTVARTGDTERARKLADAAETITMTLAGTGWTTAELVWAIAKAGDLDRAEAIAMTIDPPTIQQGALGHVGAAAATAGDIDRAESVAAAVTEPRVLAEILTRAAGAAARAGEPNRARSIGLRAANAALAVPDPHLRALALIELLTTTAPADPPGATALADQIERLAGDLTDQKWKHSIVFRLIGLLAAMGDYNRAQAATAMTEGPHQRAEALAGIARVAAYRGAHDEARRLVAEAEAGAAAQTMTEPARQAWTSSA